MKLSEEYYYKHVWNPGDGLVLSFANKADYDELLSLEAKIEVLEKVKNEMGWLPDEEYIKEKVILQSEYDQLTKELGI